MSWRARDPQAILPRGLNAVAICAIAAFALAPVLFMVLMSVTPDAEVAGGRLWPSHLALDNYVQMWSTVPLMSGLANSIAAALTAAVIATAFAVGAAYCLTGSASSAAGRTWPVWSRCSPFRT